MKHLRPRIGLRLLLLLVAQFCVLMAYLRARADLHREKARGVMMGLESRIEILEGQIKRAPRSGRWHKPELAKIKAELEELKKKFPTN
jgi:hypothetical protein